MGGGHHDKDEDKIQKKEVHLVLCCATEHVNFSSNDLDTLIFLLGDLLDTGFISPFSRHPF